MLSSKAHNIAAALLAAGASTRMEGRHKLRLPLHDGRMVFEYSLAQAASWQPVQLVVVVQPGMEDLQSAAALSPADVDIVVNEAYLSGMSSSLRAGISALRPNVEAVLVLLGDQPFVEQGVISSLVETFLREGKPIAIPVYGEVPGPPTLFRRDIFPELLALTGDEGGRQVVRKDPSRVARVPFPTDMMPPDLDTLEDYERMMRKT